MAQITFRLPSPCRLVASITLVTIASFANAAGEIPQQGTIKRLDADKGTITVTVGGKDLDFAITDKTRFWDIPGTPLLRGIHDAHFKEGALVMFLADTGDGKPVLAILSVGSGTGTPPTREPPAKVDMSKLIPLTDMGKEDAYQGYNGGLYPDVSNRRPPAHEAAGLARAKQIQPLDAGGKPDPNGKIVLLSVGMSNTQQEFHGLMEVSRDDQEINPHVVLVNDAEGGTTAQIIQTAEGVRNYQGGRSVKYWSEIDDRLKKAGVTPAQVQVIWLKQANGYPTEGFPQAAQILQGQLAKIVQLVHQRYPNVKLVYLSSRTCAAFAKTRLNPEPYAYEGGFAVKWLIEQQIQGDPALNFDATRGEVKAPWLSWGPYLWANGLNKRADGFFYVEDDFRQDDRTHPSLAGQFKVGRLLLQFMKNDTTTRGWFRKSSAPGQAGDG